jgi:hypothetical protein
MNKKFKFSFLCDENPMKMPVRTVHPGGKEGAITNGEHTYTTRHCTSCERNIVDFTTFTPQQITEYIKSNKKPCGFIFPWQEDQVNAYLKHQKESKSSPILKMAKIAAVAGSPLLFNPAVAQKTNPDIEININRNSSKTAVTEVLLKDLNGLPIDSLNMDLYYGTELLTTLKSDEFGKITIDHSLYTDKNVLILKNTTLNLEKTIALRGESSCIIWKTTFSKEEQILAEQLNKFDFQFIYSDGNEKPIRHSKIDIQLYDTTNVLIESISTKSNMSGYSDLKTSNIGKVGHISFVIYTRHGRRTAYVYIEDLKKSEINIVTVNKKFRQRLAGVMSF